MFVLVNLIVDLLYAVIDPARAHPGGGDGMSMPERARAGGAQPRAPSSTHGRGHRARGSRSSASTCARPSASASSASPARASRRSALSILGLIEPPGRVVGGEIRLGGRDISKLSDRQLRRGARQGDRARAAGPAERARSGQDDRLADRSRRSRRTSPSCAARRRASARPSCCARSRSRRPSAGSTTTPTSTRAACASAWRSRSRSPTTRAC